MNKKKDELLLDGDTLNLARDRPDKLSSLCETIALQDTMKLFRTYDWDDVGERRVYIKMFRELSRLKDSTSCHVLPFHLTIEDSFRQAVKSQGRAQWEDADLGFYFCFDFCRRVLHMPKLGSDAEYEMYKEDRRERTKNWLLDNHFTKRTQVLTMENYSDDKGRGKTQTLWNLKNGFQEKAANMENLKTLGRAIDDAIGQYDIVTLPVGLECVGIPHEVCVIFHRKYKQKQHRTYFFDSNNGVKTDGFWKHRMFPTQRHGTWYLAHLFDNMQRLGFLQDVQDDLIFEDQESALLEYWPPQYMITIPYAWTATGSAVASLGEWNKLTQADRKSHMDENLFMHTDRVLQTTHYRSENDGFCIPLTLLLNVALTCFGQKALTNRWWNKLYLRVTQQTKVGDGLELRDYAYDKIKGSNKAQRGDWLAQTLVVMYLRSFMFRLYTALGIKYTKTIVHFSQMHTFDKAMKGNLDPVTFII